MTLAALIRKREAGVATAIPAISATQKGGTAGTVAEIATVAVASPQNAKAEGVDLPALLTEACHGVEGIKAATFRALLSPEDIEDIEGGHIPVVTLNAYARSFAEGIRCGRITVLAAAIPKPTITERVRCADCRRFKPDTIGDGAGIGRCVIGGEGTGPRYPALWANAERECQDFEAI